MMKRILLLLTLVVLPVLACSQTVTTSPVTIEWDGESELHEVGVQQGTEDIIILGGTTELEYYIDLQSHEIYGTYVVLVRGVSEESGYYDYSEWARSDSEEDVIQIDGEYQTFMYISIKPASKPAMLRIK